MATHNKKKNDKQKINFEIRLLWRISFFHVTKQEHQYLLEGFDNLKRDVLDEYRVLIPVPIKLRKVMREELFRMKCYSLLNLLLDARKKNIKWLILDVDGQIHLDMYPAYTWL